MINPGVKPRRARPERVLPCRRFPQQTNRFASSELACQPHQAVLRTKAAFKKQSLSLSLLHQLMQLCAKKFYPTRLRVELLGGRMFVLIPVRGLLNRTRHVGLNFNSNQLPPFRRPASSKGHIHSCIATERLPKACLHF